MIAMPIESTPCISTMPECDDIDNSGWCSLPDICRLLGMADINVDSDSRFQRRRVKAGQWVFSAGEKFNAVFIVYSGFLKTLLLDDGGNQQILGFPMRGDLLGIDGLHNQHYASQASALTDCDLVVIPFRELTSLGHQNAMLENWLYRAVSRELVREHAVVGMLGTMGAEARVARFLVALSERFAAIGYSPNCFNLRMTRQEIGSYLGLTIETVSRSLSALHDAGLIHINQRAVEVCDLAALRLVHKMPTVPKMHRQASSEPLRPLNTSRQQSVWAGLGAMSA